MIRLEVLGRSMACAAFALAGLPTREVRDVAEGVAAIRAMVEQDDLGVVLVEQEILDAVLERDRRDLERRTAPIIVPFPGPRWTESASGAESYVLELLRRAIGYRVRLQ
jgi:V/A-type H+-transporting ATPase subunit F